MKANWTPTIFEFSEDYIEPIFQNKGNAIFLFSEDKSAAYQTVFAEAAKAHKGQVLFSTSAVSRGIQEKLGEFQGEIERLVAQNEQLVLQRAAALRQKEVAEKAAQAALHEKSVALSEKDNAEKKEQAARSEKAAFMRQKELAEKAEQAARQEKAVALRQKEIAEKAEQAAQEQKNVALRLKEAAEKAELAARQQKAAHVSSRIAELQAELHGFTTS